MIADVIRQCFPVAAKAVQDKAEEINKLNVFPVPDGDTGTNMSLTLKTVVSDVEALPPDADMAAVAKAITHGSLMGARGNSGVITSQILRGFAEGLVECKDDPITTRDFADAARNAKKIAFQAVRKPVEGTILTVVSDISAKADECAKQRMDLSDALKALVTQAYESVARTPDLLPVLKENGVVDSGAFGFAVFFEAFVNAVTGDGEGIRDFKTTVDTGASDEHAQAKQAVSDVVHFVINDDWEGSEFRYCTEFLFKADDPSFDKDKNLDWLAQQGDCELLVGSFPDYKLHVHVNAPDKVLHHMLEQGQIFEVLIHNMDLEGKERTAILARDAEAAAQTHEDVMDAPSIATSAPAKKELGFVAVAAGSGEADILKSLGVDQVVSGGQTMNPSTADILTAIEKCNAKNVIVLPDNGNIRMAAEAAAGAVDDCKVTVVPTKTVPQAFAAMFVVENDKDIDTIADAMREAISEMHDGEVTTAIRDSQAADGSPIKKGDVMGIQDGDITVVGESVDEVTLALVRKMQEADEGDTLTILAGKDMPEDKFEALCAKIEEAEPDLEMDPHRGEQPLYPIIFSIE